MVGRVHSIETLGAVDGPGVRCIVFLQGCPLRCQYCHNPDTWTPAGGTLMMPEAVADRVARYRPYFRNDGGVTVSGGEPFMQAQFTLEVLRACRERGIHTAVDTCGAYLNDTVREALRYTDLVLLDIKHTDPERYRELTGGDLDRTLSFLQYVAEQCIPLWVRQVIVPGMNDTQEAMHALSRLICHIPSLQKVELLPYRTIGVCKWDALGLSYPLHGVPEPSAELMVKLQDVIDRECRSCGEGTAELTPLPVAS